NKKCGSTLCASDGDTCAKGSDCCGGVCTGNKCVALNTSCKTAGNDCASDNECCSQLCSSGHCQLGASYCTQTGDVCARDGDCCSAVCTKASGAALGICGQPPSGASNCSGDIDGTVCSACGSCCSRLCAPYAATGVYICQPASGCHVNGDLCRSDKDCCGASGTGLPGDGHVTCEKDASGDVVGICRNPMACNPQGDVCHYKNYACSISSSRNDCCGGVGNSGVCQLDKLGVPRCNGLGDACQAAGDVCASADDCCNDAPCVPDANGDLHCYKPPTGEPNCVPGGGGCTITGDCCVGSTCVTPIGSTMGTCSIPPPTGGSGGSGGTGGGAGSGGTGGGAGTGGSGAGGTGGTGGSGSGPCAQYGQSCKVTSDCCSGIPCTSGSCVFPVK
ncbi:MAG TPA: hypothetical protein VHM19_05595, partial [Polyangiales bacterium]|nr:hypothetical protein [Polyangiales bacterium]